MKSLKSLRRSRRILLAALVAAPLLGGCDNITGVDNRDRAQARLDRAWDRFFDVAPESYSYVMRRECECPFDVRRPVQVWVDRGFVEYLIYDDTGTAVPLSYSSAFFSAEDLFDIIQDAIYEDADIIDVEYDATYGYPTSIYIDYDRRIVDEEFVVQAWGLRSWD